MRLVALDVECVFRGFKCQPDHVMLTSNPLTGKDEISRAENLSFYTRRWVPRIAATNARLCNNLSKCPVKRF